MTVIDPNHGEGFLATEFPTQFLAQRISKLGVYLGTNIMIWGLILAFHAACTTFAGLAVVRTLLGVFESCGLAAPSDVVVHPNNTAQSHLS